MRPTQRDLVQQAASDKVIWAAWSKVAARSAAPGVDGVTPSRFGEHLPANIAQLQTLLRSGTYRPQPLKQIVIGRPDHPRVLGLPTVRDRVAQRAVLEVLASRLDAEAADVSFAYRKGRSWLDALARAERCRDQGLRHVFRGDIHAYFDSIDHAVLHQALQGLTGQSTCVDLIMGWVTAPYLTPNGLVERPRGIPQGAPISPALANHYLKSFDRTIEGRRGFLVRYADDVAVFCPDELAALAAQFEVESALFPLRLELNAAKSYVSSFDRGFSFLGWIFFRDRGWDEDPNDAWTHPMAVGRHRGNG